eukprot:2736775-Lingulodinium_polyedra.AAC.1
MPAFDMCLIRCRPCACLYVFVYSCAGGHDDVDEAEMCAACFMHGKIMQKLSAEHECLNIPGFACIMMETLKHPR